MSDDNNIKVAIKDPRATIKATIDAINTISVRLKDRNMVGPIRDKAYDDRYTLLDNLMMLVAGAIITQAIERDEWGVLACKVDPKVFKESKDINSILSKVRSEKADKRPLSNLSEIEIARILNPPVEKLPEDDGETTVEDVLNVVKVQAAEGDFTVNKEEGTIEATTADGKTVKAKLPKGEEDGWFSSASGFLTKSLNVSWSCIKAIATKTMELALVVIFLIIGLVIGTGMAITKVASIGRDKSAEALANINTESTGDKK